MIWSGSSKLMGILLPEWEGLELTRALPQKARICSSSVGVDSELLEIWNSFLLCTLQEHLGGIVRFRQENSQFGSAQQSFWGVFILYQILNKFTRMLFPKFQP